MISSAPRAAALLGLVVLAACAESKPAPEVELGPAASGFVSGSGTARGAAPGAPASAEPAPAPAARTPRERAPAAIRGIYLNAYAAGTPERRAALLALADSTEINTFVIDVKTENGIHYQSEIPLARELAQSGHVTIPDLKAYVERLHAHGLYAVARIVVFKDPILSRAKPEWSIQRPGGGLWVDKAGNTWVSAWDPGVWDYNIRIAEEAAQAGFDEVQFDYVRFPEPYKSLPAQVHAREAGDRTDAIAAFLAEAVRRVRPLGAVVGADLFGLSMNEAADVGIGQQWERLSTIADHLLPMVYPSHYFPTHLKGVSRPNRMPYETVFRSVGMGVIRNDRIRADGGTPARIIPWLQAFDAPWVDRDFPYGPEQVRAQIDAVYALGLEDWILWHPGSKYAAAAFERSVEPRARAYTPPEVLLTTVDRFEEWGMKGSRERALREPATSTAEPQ